MELQSKNCDARYAPYVKWFAKYTACTYNVNMINFDWDSAKAEINIKKHGISFEEATSIFYDEYAMQFFDEKHSDIEDRFLMLGMSNNLNVLIVCHCERDDGNTIRIISSRKATKNEIKHYRRGH